MEFDLNKLKIKMGIISLYNEKMKGRRLGLMRFKYLS